MRSSSKLRFASSKSNTDVDSIRLSPVVHLACPKTGEKRPAPTETLTESENHMKKLRAWNVAKDNIRLETKSERESIESAIARNLEAISSLEDVKLELAEQQCRFLRMLKLSKKNGHEDSVKRKKDKLENVQAEMRKLDKEIARREKRVKNLGRAKAELYGEVEIPELKLLIAG